MRTIKELLQLMLNNVHLITIYNCGICDLRLHLDFTQNEKKVIFEYINSNKPWFKYIRLYEYDYWWKKGKVKPRIKWLEKYIKLNKE